MKNIQNKLIILFFISLAFPRIASSQENLDFDLSCNVNKIHPYISITTEKLAEAKTLTDLNSRYESSWVKEYLSVEILTSYKGAVKKIMAKNDVLSQEQKDIMNMADVNTDISIKVRYIPDNTLRHNDVQEINFTFSVEPEKEATYSGGEQQLKKYLKDNLMDKISVSSFRKHHLTAVKFTINEEGKIINPHVFESSSDEKMDKLLLETICNMPNWKPAEYANGTKVKQEFVFAIGDMNSCVINLLNIRKNSKVPMILYKSSE